MLPAVRSDRELRSPVLSQKRPSSKLNKMIIPQLPSCPTLAVASTHQGLAMTVGQASTKRVEVTTMTALSQDQCGSKQLGKSVVNQRRHSALHPEVESVPYDATGSLDCLRYLGAPAHSVTYPKTLAELQAAADRGPHLSATAHKSSGGKRHKRCVSGSTPWFCSCLL